MTQLISQKIALLNQTTLNSLVDVNSIKIMEHFTEAGINILDADFGFAWWKTSEKAKYKLAYKSVNTPYEPNLPRKSGGNYTAKKTKTPFFMEHVVKDNYEKGYDVSPYMKSYVIIPITYKDYIYGSIILCYKREYFFSQEDRELAAYLGNTTAQSITINRLIAKEQEARELALRQEAYFKALVENSHEIIMLMDQKGKIRYVSSSIEKIFGLQAKDIVGHRGREFIYNHNDDKIDEFLNDIVIHPTASHVMEFNYRDKSGSMLWMEVTAINMLNNPNVKGIVLNIHDITERKKSEMLKETERLLKEEQLKTEFIANATHEIRTPLAIIRGNADIALMKRAKVSRTSARAFKAINHEVEHLSNMIADLTTLTSREVSLREGIILKEVNLTHTIEHIAKTCIVLAKKKKISLKVKIDPDVRMMADKAYLEKLFLNLIRNAINYGNVGGWIRIESKIENDQVKVTVSDNGIGIDKDDLPHIFSRFYRVDKSHTSDNNSTGLGLPIVKWIVNAHRGSIEVKSKLGKGTSFTISLPILK